jgi:hypothetical protein
LRVARLGFSVLLPAVFLAAAAPASAKDGESLAGLLLRFFSPANPVVLRPAPDPFNHAAHFVSQPEAQAILTQFNQGIASQLSTFPLGSSSAGFTYTFDPALGVYNRSTQTFGPVIAERPLTAGKGKFSFGVNYQKANYDRLDGRSLTDGGIQFYLRHQDVNNDHNNLEPWFEGDVIRADLFLDLSSQTTVFFLNYGVSDRFDLGAAIPYQKMTLDAHIDATIDHLATSGDPFVLHAFPNGTDVNGFDESGEASGLGDVVLRGKFNFRRSPTGSLAAALDLRLPTGDADNLLGTGGTQAKLYLIAGGSTGRFSPRASAGYTASFGGADFLGDLPNEINYSAGFDAGLHPKVTLTADLLGRYLLNANRLVDQDLTLSFRTQTNPTVRTATRTAQASETGNLNLLLGSAGVRVNPAGRLLLVANVLFALGSNGLQDKLIPMVGIDYSF